jgi:hypothetical protein
MQDTPALAQCLGQMSGVVNAELRIEPSQKPDLLPPPTQDSDSYTYYAPLPQSPSAFDAECSVTVHFPKMSWFNQDDLVPSESTSNPPQYAASLSPENQDSLSHPHQGQDISFSVDRCHHRGIEHGDELPFGFTDVLEQMLRTPSNVSFETV